MVDFRPFLHLDNPVVFDIETSGGASPQIIQVAALNPRTADRFEIKVKFNERHADPNVLDIVHYDPLVWKAEAVSPNRARRRFARWLRKHASVRRVTQARNRYLMAVGLGHNAHAFDWPMLAAWYADSKYGFPMDARVFDTLQLSMWLRPGLASYKLGDLCGLLGVGREGAHDAVVDCEMAADLAAILLTRLEFQPSWVLRRVRAIARRNGPQWSAQVRRELI